MKNITQHILFILLFASPSFCVGQTCDTAWGGTVNCLDALGKKQDKWIDREEKLALMSHSWKWDPDAGIHRCTSDSKVGYNLISEGYYEDGEMVGIWKYYSNEWRGSSTLIRTEEYLDDGTVLKKDMWLGHTLAFNRGDSIPYQVVTQLGDSVQISCGKETCRFSVADELIIEPFDKNRLQFEIERVALNCYDRRIKLAATKAGK